jgi:hypothetical protein
MKKFFNGILTEFKAHKIIDSVLVVLVVFTVVVVVMVANQDRTAVVVAPIGGSSTMLDESTAVSSAAALSSETSSEEVSSSSAPAVLQSSSSVYSSSAAAVVISPEKTCSSAAPKTSSTATAKPATTSSTTQTHPTISSAESNPLYTPIPQAQECITKSMGGGSFTLNVNAFGIAGYVSADNVKQYLGDDAFIKVTENGTNKVMVSGQSGIVGDAMQVQVSSVLDTYQHDTSWWLKPATYTVTVWCQPGSLSQDTAPGRPQKVQICTFNFSVYERGFVL